MFEHKRTLHENEKPFFWLVNLCSVFVSLCEISFHANDAKQLRLSHRQKGDPLRFNLFLASSTYLWHRKALKAFNKSMSVFMRLHNSSLRFSNWAFAAFTAHRDNLQLNSSSPNKFSHSWPPPPSRTDLIEKIIARKAERERFCHRSDASSCIIMSIVDGGSSGEKVSQPAPRKKENHKNLTKLPVFREASKHEE